MVIVSSSVLKCGTLQWIIMTLFLVQPKALVFGNSLLRILIIVLSPILNIMLSRHEFINFLDNTLAAVR